MYVCMYVCMYVLLLLLYNTIGYEYYDNTVLTIIVMIIIISI